MKYFKQLSLVFILAISSFATQAASFTDTFENLIADHLLRGTALSATAPASVYISLHTTSCTDATPGTEVSGGSYARVSVARSTSAWNGTHGTTTGASSGTNGTVSNAATITFAAPTANWGSIVSFGVNDALTAGNQWVCTDLTTAKTVNNGDAAPSFGAGALTIQIDN